MSEHPGGGLTGLLVGYGSIGRRHLGNFHDLGVSRWGVVHTGQGTLPLEPPCPVQTFATVQEALERVRPHFAVVANPTNLHVETAEACLRAGCPVLLEKPVSHELQGVDGLRAAAGGGAPVLVGFQFRFHPALARIRALLAGGTLGAPLHARAIWGEHLPSWHPWEDWRTGYAARADLGGGVHHTICHPFDYLRMLLGDVHDVEASLTSRGPLGLEVAEAADVLLRFDGGVTANVHLDYWSRPAVHRLEVVCADGSIRWDYLAGSFEVWRASDEGWQAEPFPGVDERNDLFVAEAAHFLDVVAGRAAPTCTLDDGIAVVRLCAAIEESALAR